MKLVSTTLTGNHEDILGDALKSVVHLVDQCVVVDTGVTDASLKVAQEVAGKKLVVERFSWVNDFSLARNYSLDAAQRLGADWALIVDTDERIELNGEDLRSTLAATRAGLLLMPDRHHNYTKERAIRLPLTSRYVGPTHEAFPPPATGSIISEKARFHELPKSAETSRKKFQRDVDILQQYTQQHPEDPRWFYYLGDSLKNLGQLQEAVTAYARCTALHGWDEESAWACFRAAQCHEELQQFEAMRHVLSLGIARHAGIAELMWYSGYACLRLGNYLQAVYWSNLATQWGLYAGQGATVKRIGFRHLPGLFEGPYDVLRIALRELGDTAGAQDAQARFEKAKLAREAYSKK